MEVKTDTSLEGKVYDKTQHKQLAEDLNGDITLDQINTMVEKADSAKNNSYSPYSKFRVGCCLLSKNDEYFIGANVENVSYGLTICSERSGIVGAVSNGTSEFKGILVTTDMDFFVSPCGACRQFINEFNIKYSLLMDTNRNIQYYTIKHLLPASPDIYHLKK